MRKLKYFLERMVEMMAMLFAIRVVEERTTFEKVPAKLKPQVAEILLEDFGLPDLVPAEFGGEAG
ncbi:MAG: hypothetical protein IJ713_01175 [Oscillibacter sp.]|nr:hypothetical protein [Oscillibacter sp.]